MSFTDNSTITQAIYDACNSSILSSVLKNPIDKLYVKSSPIVLVRANNFWFYKCLLISSCFLVLADVYRWADLSGKMKVRVCLFFPIEIWARLHVSFINTSFFSAYIMPQYKDIISLTY